MKPDYSSVTRLGFELWADNVIVNALEDLAGKQVKDIDLGDADVTLTVRVHGSEATAKVRAYVPGMGWQHHDRVIHLKGGQP